MKIVNKNKFREYPNGTVFMEYYPCCSMEIEIKRGNYFWAQTLLPDLNNGSEFIYDWNLNEYDENDLFIVFEKHDIEQMINLLKDSLNI